ncbi:MAG: SH3-like domain-containing protein [Nitrospirae bacterium]|nr:SH3-like domain-containing protein [Nitrospirota bacterium]
MKKLSLLFVIMIALILIVSVNGPFASSEKSGELPHKKAEMKSKQDDSSLSGKVVETMDSGGYSYVKVEKNGKTTWVAVPKMKVTVGQEVSFAPGMVMQNFESKTLKRTFESIVFSSGPAGLQGAESGHKSSGQKQTESAPDMKAKEIKVDKASGPDAYTVAELYGKITELNNKKVSVRGEVVKVSPEIMGKNWVHIQDGSGNASNGSNDILVTSQDLPAVGDIVTAKGTLFKDKDFGSGYKYAVVIEEASIKK